ncbi:GNAT family N-acetyltransferase [uncultured Croceitalea sp.]|uniref:GNAT family N-acetyltransferase n=1 Tax=uncultured Croceitalea sp. TaxID=1798908 RepID=UPI0033056B43
MKINGKIRFAVPTDIPQIIELCHLHAIYERDEYKIEGKERQLSIDLFSQLPKLYCLVIEREGVLLGYATYMKQYATWDACEYIYMDCLFIREFARGLGFGEKLIDIIKLEAQQLGCAIIQWQTPDFNTRAMKFYKRIGATSKSKERYFLNSVIK